jgi:hypothetical protein
MGIWPIIFSGSVPNAVDDVQIFTSRERLTGTGNTAYLANTGIEACIYRENQAYSVPRWRFYGRN